MYKQTCRELLREVPCLQLALIALKAWGKCMGFWYANQSDPGIKESTKNRMSDTETDREAEERG